MTAIISFSLTRENKPLFQAERYQQIFAAHQLDGFLPLWLKEIDWFEVPNQRRGGWSGVGQLILSDGAGDLNVFVKKQQNHGRKTLLHPIRGEPTFRREFKRLTYLSSCQIAAPKVVFYGEDYVHNNACAILVTEALVGFSPLDWVMEDWQNKSQSTYQQKQNLIKAIALAVRRLHAAGLTHRALYPKHIFVKNAATHPEVALIDLEKARFGLLFLYRSYFDLSALNRHLDVWTRTQKLTFFLHYFQVNQLNKGLKLLLRLILRRSARSSLKR